MRRFAAVVLCLCCSMLLVSRMGTAQTPASSPGQAEPAAALSTPAGAAWSYDGKNGPLNWSRLDPAYKACANGKEQSPIDIRGAHLNKSLKPIEFHYLSGAMTLLNTGHTIRVSPPAGSYIVVDGARYDLVEFHFHHPGEEAVKGKLPDMTLDLVHKNAEGKMAIIAVRLNEGRANAVLADLWQHLPAIAGATDKLTESLSPAGLLPADRGYWTYAGSITVPPCTEGVRWFVFEQELEISRDQLKSFAALYKVNSRVVQPTHGRRIEANQ